MRKPSAEFRNPDPLLTPAEVASIFRVDPKTVGAWAKAGKIGAIKTLGGHRRFYESEVRALLESGAEPKVDGRDLEDGGWDDV